MQSLPHFRARDFGRTVALPAPSPLASGCEHVADWEPRPGGALGRCKLCGGALGALYVVLGDELRCEQLVWLVAALMEPRA
jgi:hypothetical protein